MHKDQRMPISLGLFRRGHFVYRITGGACPQYTYTVGVTEAVVGLLFDGGAVFDAADLNLILNTSPVCAGARPFPILVGASKKFGRCVSRHNTIVD